eukprot:3195420-Pyramimonas_sp.AAC.1
MAPQGAPPKAPVAALAWNFRALLGTPLIRVVAPQGDRPQTLVAALAWRHRAHFSTPFTCFV